MLVNKMSRIMGWLRGWGALVVCFALLTCFSTSSQACYPPIGGLAVTTNLTIGGTISLSSVVGPNADSVQVGDKLFSNFALIPTSSPPDLLPSDVVIQSLVNGDGYGLGFNFKLTASGSTSKDIVLEFSVTVLDPNELISDVHLNFTSAVSGLGFATVAESIFTNGFGAGLISTLQVNNPGTPAVFEDTAFFDVPQHKIWIEKDILVDGNGTSSTTDWAHISIIDQTISQMQVPEPSTMALSVVGLAMCLFVKRRR